VPEAERRLGWFCLKSNESKAVTVFMTKREETISRDFKNISYSLPSQLKVKVKKNKWRRTIERENYYYNDLLT